MSEISSDSVVQRRDDLLANDLSDTETVMLDVAGGTYYGLKDVGKVIWDHLDSPVKVDDLCEQLIDEFEVDPDMCRRETLAFLETLHERGLVVVSQVIQE